MFKILKKTVLSENISKMTISAPNVAKFVEAGQFVILRVDEVGERIPLTVFDYNRELGTIDIVYQKVGVSTYKLDEENDFLADVVGPLGKKSKLCGYKNAIVVAGGLGSAIAYPLAKSLKLLGTHTTIIAGFRSQNMIILEDEMKSVCDDFMLMTDDGSSGGKGFVTQSLVEKLKQGENCDLVIAVGPIPMMKAVCDVTKGFDVKTIVSMTAIMIDGTGMCGGCRLTVGGKVKFACVDGPDFDGHEVDFEEAMARSRNFEKEEKKSCEKYCNLLKGV